MYLFFESAQRARMKLKVDVQQAFISTTAIFGIGLFWFNFNTKVFKTGRHLISALFTWPKEEEHVSDSEEEEPKSDSEEEHVCEACWADHD